MRKLLFLILLLPFLFSGCKKDQASIDNTAIQNYISSHHLTAIAEPNGLYYVQTQAGSGGSPTDSSQVTVIYTGYFTNGNIFDQSYGLPLTFSLTSTIAGWQQGIPLMQKGGKGTLLIPSALGYGSAGSGSTIPSNSVLIFDIDLVNFQ